MGTRSLTIFKGEKDSEIVVMYKQYDGYPTTLGLDLATFLSGMRIVNGYSSASTEKQANGMNCLAAQVVSHFKEEIGDIYLYSPNTRDCGEEFIYTITGNVGQEAHINVWDVYYKKVLFCGPASEVKQQIETEK